MPRLSFVAIVASFALLVACAPEPDEPPPPPPAADDDDSGEAVIDDDDATDPLPYVGPAYDPCVADAQCDPGSACTTVPGYDGLYCAPPCDPAGDGSECALLGLPYDTMCLANGRCARACDDEAACPDSVACAAVTVGDAETDLCAGEPSGVAGFYGICTHPNVDGLDCPEETQCLGGALVGTDELGICLPWCDDGTCPTPPAETVAASPLCYDIGFDHPLCVLLCPLDGSGECPYDQFCLNTGFGVGICAPEGAEVPDDVPL